MNSPSARPGITNSLMKSQVDRFKSLHHRGLPSFLSLPDLDDYSPEEDARRLRARKGSQRMTSLPSIATTPRELHRQQAIQKYLEIRGIKDTKYGSLKSIPSEGKSLKPKLNGFFRSGSLPTLSTLFKIEQSPSNLVQSTANLYLNGFSVTLEELEEMFQVWRKQL